MSILSQTHNDPGPQPHGQTGFPAYLFLHGMWFLVYGLQMVLFPFLVRIVLGMSEEALGIAQMSLNIPTTILIVFGGLIADRVDGRRQILRLYLIAAIPFFLMGLLVSSGALSYPLVIAYALCVGTIGAFVIPARDALLSDVAPHIEGGGLQRAVAQAGLAQFTGQLLGMLLATLAKALTVTVLLFGQSVFMLIAATAALALRPRAGQRGNGRSKTLSLTSYVSSEVLGGFRAVVSSPVIAPVSLLSVAIGIAFMGSFLVLMPLIVETYFPADLPPERQGEIAAALGLFSLCFWLGTIVTSLLLLRIGMPRRRGTALLAALFTGAVVLFVCSNPMPYAMLCVLNFVWGIAGGVSMTLSRALVQEAAPATHRARILSIYSLGFIGGAPIGALCCGFLAGAVGPFWAILAPSALMACSIAYVIFAGHRRTIDNFSPAAAGQMAPT